MIAGFLGRKGSRGALVTMLGLGLVVGIASVILSWTTEPHGYSVLLFLSFFPLAWAGWAFAR